MLGVYSTEEYILIPVAGIVGEYTEEYILIPIAGMVGVYRGVYSYSYSWNGGSIQRSIFLFL